MLGAIWTHLSLFLFWQSKGRQALWQARRSGWKPNRPGAKTSKQGRLDPGLDLGWGHFLDRETGSKQQDCHFLLKKKEIELCYVGSDLFRNACSVCHPQRRCSFWNVGEERSEGLMRSCTPCLTGRYRISLFSPSKEMAVIPLDPHNSPAG